MEKLSQEILQRLDLLAQKLGTTVEHLWAVLVRQAYIEAVFAIVILVFEIILFTVAVRHISKSFDLASTEPVSSCSDSRIFKSAVLGVLAFIFFIVAAASLSTIGYLANPEIYALQELQKILK